MSGPFMYAATQDLGLLDFRTGVLDPRITFTRASVGTYFDAAGVLQTAAVNAPRFDHHPTTLKRLGLLIEGQRTNLILNSAAMATQSVTVTATAHTLSFTGTGTVTLSGASTAGPLIGTGANDRVSLTFTPSAGTLTLTVSGSVTLAQCEAGAYASSYISTAGATVTRSADVCSGTPSAFGVIDAEGTMYAEFSFAGGSSADSASGRRILEMDDGTSSNRHLIYNLSSGLGGLSVVAAATQATSSIAGTVGANGALLKAAYAYKANDFQAARNGSVSAVDSSGSVPAGLSRINVGGSAVGAIGGVHVRLMQLYPRRLSAAVLAKLTS